MWRRDPGVPAAERRWALGTTLTATALFWLVLCRWRPWDLFARGGFTADFYDVQADAFWKLRLDVPADVAGIEGFLIDGKTYLYYGPLLAVARMPVVLFGDWTDGRLTRLSMLIAFVCLCTVAFHLARRVARLVGAPAGASWRPALLIAAVAFSPALALAGRTSVYHETELWALVLILATFVALADVLREPSARPLALAGAAAVATLLTRASIGFGALSALAIVGCWPLWTHQRRLGVAALATSALGALVHVGINLAKFGAPLDLPADRQVLTLIDPERAAWFDDNGGSFFGLDFLPTTVLQYVRPDAIRFERLLPMVRFGPPAHEFGSPLESNTPSSSLTASATLLVVMAVIGVVLLVRGRHWRLAALLAGAAVVALVSWGAVVNTALAVWLDGIVRPGFTAWRYDVDDELFGGSPPAVTDARRADGVPRDGIVGIDGDCAGLYIASQGEWVPLELADGTRRLRATFDPAEGFGSLSTDGGDGISLVVAQDGTALVTTHHPATGEETQHSIDWPGDGPVPLPAMVEITSDPVAGGLLGGLTVLVDGRLALRVFEAPDLSGATAWGGLQLVPPEVSTTPTCDRIAARR